VGAIGAPPYGGLAGIGAPEYGVAEYGVAEIGGYATGPIG
jgi:hypothetical protein